MLPSDVPAMGKGESEAPFCCHHTIDLGRVPIPGKCQISGLPYNVPIKVSKNVFSIVFHLYMCVK